MMWVLALSCGCSSSAGGDPAATVADTDEPAVDTAPGSDTTTPVATTGLQITSPDARACEVLLLDPTEVLTEAAFAAGVDGRFVKEGQRTAIAVITTGDTAFPTDAITLRATGDLAAVTVKTGACFDRLGAEIPGAAPSVQP